MESPARQVRRSVETIASLDRASDLVLVAAWIGVNTLLPGWRWDRPPFFWLQGLIAVLSLATTTVVLITQNRWIRRVERRAGARHQPRHRHRKRWTLSVESEVGRGSMFRAELPAAPAEA